MYWKNDGEEDESFRPDIMKHFETYQQFSCFIIASANSDFTDEDGDNPPHGKARRQYEKIVDAGHFLCTHEHPNKESPEPIVFQLSQSGFSLINSSKSKNTQGAASLMSAVAAARGGTTPPQQQVGFGRI